MEPFEWAMCGDPTDPLQVFSASLSPYPIKFSKDRELPITLALNGSLTKDVGAMTCLCVLTKLLNT